MTTRTLDSSGISTLDSGYGLHRASIILHFGFCFELQELICKRDGQKKTSAPVGFTCPAVFNRLVLVVNIFNRQQR